VSTPPRCDEVCVGERARDDRAERLTHDALPPVRPRQLVAHLGAAQLLGEEEEAARADDGVNAFECDAPADAFTLRLPAQLALNQVASIFY
jgi:hypothetical protein